MPKGAGPYGLDEADLLLERPRRTLADIAADKLREFILVEKLPPGAPIAEREVAAALGISRTPLRAALAILVQDGLVDYSVTRRPRVADPSLAEITQNLEVMGALEALAGELACRHATDAEIEEVLELERQMREGESRLAPIEFFRIDMEMHGLIARASHNQALIETHRQYNARLWRARFLSSKRDTGRTKVLDQHATAVRALAARDATATAEVLRAHLASTVGNIAAVFEDRSTENRPETDGPA